MYLTRMNYVNDRKLFCDRPQVWAKQKAQKNENPNYTKLVIIPRNDSDIKCGMSIEKCE